MGIGAKPPADFLIDESLVRRLIAGQHPDLSALSLMDAGEGWDNRLFRLGDELVVRLPRRESSALLIEHEQHWLPRLAARLPLPVSVPLRVGRAGAGYPWPWSITSWFPGRSADHTSLQNAASAAATLGRFLRALHEPAPSDAPVNVLRGIPIEQRAARLQADLARAEGLVDRRAVLDVWSRLAAAPPWSGPPLWIHGDFHPGNLIVSEGQLSAVVDFGDLTAGDPATDLSVAWMLLPASARPIFRAAARGSFDDADDATWMRARGWALALGVAYVASSRDDPVFRALALATIDAALREA